MAENQHRGAVLITGTSTGIGRTAALELDRLGFSVFATVRREEDAASLRSEASERLSPVHLDVTDSDTIAQAREQVSQAVGDTGLWGLVNNAGIGFSGPLEYVPLDELRWIFEVNVFGLLAVTQAFLPFIRRARGRIVNISSIASIAVAPFHGPYSATKLSVNGLSDALRRELYPFGVQVSVIKSGFVQTPIWETGAQLSDRVHEQMPSEAWDLYGVQYRQLGHYFQRMGQSGGDPQVVAQAIHHALTAKQAKQTYYVGRNAQQLRIMDKVLHGRLGDWVLRRSIGLTDR
jgi:NAD(P)-dependent dehydrogenase (short-subunit alcohol dehydrogenase family)